MVKEILFPCFCVDCGLEGEWWCPRCLAELEIEFVRQCPVCGQATSAGEACQDCEAVSYLDGVTAFFSYREGDSLARLIKQFKYDYAREIAVVWQRILAKRPNFLPPDFVSLNMAVMPVPLHPRRQRWRGFNQAEIITQTVGQIITVGRQISCLTACLYRTRHTEQQARLTGEQRRRNLAGAFSWRGKSDVPAEVLLVDDIFTTGSTLQECAKVLKANGGKRVWGLVLARG